MKRTFRILLVFYGVVLLLLSSCHKSDYLAGSISTINNSSNNSNKNLIDLFNALQSKPQLFKINAGTYQSVYAANGTKLSFYPNSFKDAKGNIISNTTIDIQITEMYNADRKIENALTTVTNGKLLGTAGQVFVKATRNGEEVFANKYGISFKTNSASQQQTALYAGTVTAPSPFVTWYAVGAVSDETVVDSFRIVTVDTSGNGIDTMTFRTNYNRFDSCNTFNWISCGYFLASGGVFTNINVRPVDSAFDYTNTAVFLMFPGSNSVTTLSNYNTSTRSFSLCTGYEVPLGTKANLVVVANMGGKYYYYLQTGITVTNGMSFNPTMTLATITELQTALQAL